MNESSLYVSYLDVHTGAVVNTFMIRSQGPFGTSGSCLHISHLDVCTGVAVETNDTCTGIITDEVFNNNDSDRDSVGYRSS